MANVTSGVYPVFDNVFKIGTKGVDSEDVDMKTIADCETFSLSMTESWALGIPTIATDDYGMKEIVEKYIPLYCDVILFNKGDVVDLVAKILNLYNDECLYRKVSDAVYCVIREHLNEGKFKKRLLNEISSII